MKASRQRQLAAIAALVMLTTSGCAATLTEGGRKVKLMMADPPAGCRELGGVSGYAVGANYQDRLKAKLRNDAADQGGNYVRLEQLTNDGNAAGTAYQCPESGLGSAP